MSIGGGSRRNLYLGLARSNLRPGGHVGVAPIHAGHRREMRTRLALDLDLGTALRNLRWSFETVGDHAAASGTRLVAARHGDLGVLHRDFLVAELDARRTGAAVRLGQHRDIRIGHRHRAARRRRLADVAGAGRHELSPGLRAGWHQGRLLPRVDRLAVDPDAAVGALYDPARLRFAGAIHVGPQPPRLDLETIAHPAPCALEAFGHRARHDPQRQRFDRNARAGESCFAGARQIEEAGRPDLEIAGGREFGGAGDPENTDDEAVFAVADHQYFVARRGAIRSHRHASSHLRLLQRDERVTPIGVEDVPGAKRGCAFNIDDHPILIFLAV